MAHRAGIRNALVNTTGFEELGVPVFYAKPDSVTLHKDEPAIIVVPASPDAWHRVISDPHQHTTWLSAKDVFPGDQQLPIGDSLPVFFWGEGFEDGSQPFAELRNDGRILFYADIVAATLFMLSRYEEINSEYQDEHGRFPAKESVACKLGILDRPLVDEYGLILRHWIKHLLPGWQPVQHNFKVLLSHDIDYIQPFGRAQNFLLTFAGDLIQRHSLGSAYGTIKAGAGQVLNNDHNACIKGIDFLANASLEYGFHSTFNFLARKDADPFLGSGYDPRSKLVINQIQQLQKQGFEIGYHASYNTMNDLDMLIDEKKILVDVIGSDQIGGRYHYLRCRIPESLQNWDTAGLVFDSSLGFGEHEGFRCGTCHPYPYFDLVQDRQLTIQEIPLIVMDATLAGYRKFKPSEGIQRAVDLAQRCKKVEGIFTLLWHNTSTYSKWHAWVKPYREMLSTLAAL